jgi:hypothetical protein
MKSIFELRVCLDLLTRAHASIERAADRFPAVRPLLTPLCGRLFDEAARVAFEIVSRAALPAAPPVSLDANRRRRAASLPN